MANSNTLFPLLLLAAIALLLLVLAVRYFLSYAKCIRHIKAELAQARSWKDQAYWRRELHTLRLCILPGLTPDRVRAIRRFFYRGRYARHPELDDGLSTMLVPSLLSICLCLTCLVGGTYAWFTATQTTSTQTITAANFSVEVTVTDPSGTPVSPDVNGIYTLGAGEYTLLLTAKGTASKGYCIIDRSYMAVGGDIQAEHESVGPLMKGETYTVKVQIAHTDTKMLITPCWGVPQ